MVDMVSIILRPNSKSTRWLVALFLITIITIAKLGWLDPLINFLVSEHCTFKIGTLEFTLYRIIKSIILVIVIFWFASIVSIFGEKNIKKIKGISSSNSNLVIKGFQTILYLLVSIITLDMLAVDLTILAVFSGAVGFGIGFGLKQITSNFISGLILLFEKSIEEGDLLEIEDGELAVISSIKARYTLAETKDGREILIPNEHFITHKVTNLTFTDPKGRASLKVFVAYTANVNLAQHLISDAIFENQEICKSPKPECILSDYSEDSIIFTVHFWVNDIKNGIEKQKNRILLDIWKKFKDNDIDLPHKQYNINIAGKNNIIKSSEEMSFL